MSRWLSAVTVTAGLLLSATCLADYTITVLYPTYRIKLCMGDGGFPCGQLPYPMGDFDGDGRMEFISLDANVPATLTILDAITGQTEFEATSPDLAGGTRAAAIDLDADGFPEAVVFSGAQGFVVAVISHSGSPAAMPEQPTRELHPERGTVPYPNPASNGAALTYVASAKGLASLRIYDASGRLVRAMPAEVDKGEHEIRWDGADSNGVRLPSGTYFYQLDSAGKSLASGKAIVLK